LEENVLRKLKRWVVGTPLSSEMIQHERIPKWKALAVLSSDALSSVAYATEEVLIPLSLFAAAAVSWSIPIALAIAFLLIVVTVSYRQTIEAYPGGGGAYTVARDNLGEHAGLVAGAALLIDYVLTVSVSVAAGIENFASAFPALLPHKMALDVAVIIVIMMFNFRGVRESANIFALPTYLFIFSFVVMIASGFWQLANGSAVPAAPLVHESYPAIPVFLLLRAFSSGCAALTGIEAISNGIPIFRVPSQRNAKTTMAWMSFILGSLFLGMTALCHLYGIVPKEGETAVSLLARRVFEGGWFYYLVQTSTTLILVLAANTSYADFPRLSSLLAKDRYLPRQLASLGDRLVFSNGIAGLSVAAIALILGFGGETHHLIPLYAIGVFLSFTLSQSGMVMHHLKVREPHWKKALAFNMLGAATTAVGVNRFGGL
jgi:amino acid transporter